jgi:hypothetical protein
MQLGVSSLPIFFGGRDDPLGDLRYPNLMKVDVYS